MTGHNREGTVTATRVLVLNSGSSSVKYQLLDMADGSRPAAGIVERIGEPGGAADHAEALKTVADELAARGLGLDSPNWPRWATGSCTAARASPRRR